MSSIERKSERKEQYGCKLLIHCDRAKGIVAVNQFNLNNNQGSFTKDAESYIARNYNFLAGLHNNGCYDETIGIHDCEITLIWIGSGELYRKKRKLKKWT